MKKYNILMLGLLCAGVVLAAGKERRWFVGPNLVYERGSALSSEYLTEHAPDFSGKLKEILPWVVRIEVRNAFKDGGYSSNHGTGIILKGGKIYTANHVITQNVEGKIEVILTLPDGRIFPASVERQGKRDWACLQMQVSEEDKTLLESPIVMTDAKLGETAVFLGFPARLGLDQEGQVQSFNKGDKAQGIPADKLSPMLVVASAEDLDAMTFTPLAGFPPVGGMSGGPIFNLQGQMIAVQHSVSKTTEDATGKILYYKIDATPVSATKGPQASANPDCSS